MIEYKTNKVNTTLSEEILKEITKEERETILDYLSSIVFLQNLTSETRQYAKDLDRWDNPDNDTVLADKSLERTITKNGRIRVDLANPHILENTDYFREAAIHFEEHGVYTFLKPNRNPYSDYRKFWDTQIQRCWDGMTRESDGEWITGYHYFYLNFSPVMKSVKRKGSARVERLQGLPDFYDGDYWFFHYIERARENGKHTCTLKKRGAGYSLKGAGQLSRNFILGESKEADKNTVSLAIANEKEYLTKDGVLNKFVDVIDFTSKHTPFPNRRELKDSWQSMHWQMGWKDNESGLEKGNKNQVMGVTLKNDPEKARGKRAIFILWEEFGKFKDSLTAWNIARPSVEDGEYVFGLMSSFGTGGTEGASFKGLRELFYNPGGYNVYSLDNVYDKNTKKGNKCAFFHAGYLNQMGYMDKDGNSDVIMSLLSVIKKRIEIKYNSSEAHTLTQTIAEMALTPQEAIMKSTGSLFPTVDIRDYLEESRVNINKFTSTHLVGDLVIKSAGNIEFNVNFEKNPIRSYNTNKINPEGAIEIFSQPQIDPHTKEPYSYRYIAGIDPIDNDYTETGSLGSIFVFDLWNDEIVAEYTGRPQLANDFYEICRRLLVYYNAQGNYESNIKGLFGYFNSNSCLHLLCDTPSYLRDVEEQKQNLFGNRAHPYSEKVYTPEGIKKWGDIKTGDSLFNSYGGTTKVIDIPFDNYSDIYEITLKDGRKIKASDNHLWDVTNWSGCKKTLSTVDILENYYRHKGKYKESKYYIEKNEGVDYNNKEVPIESYLLGLLLGDGCFTNSKYNNADFTSSLKDLEEYKKIIPNEIHTKDDRHHSIRFPEIGKILKDLNLHDKKSRTKFIPDIYKYNTREKRLNILRGLLDTDGTVNKEKISYCSTSKQLAEDVMQVARSLGINCNLNISKNKFGEVYIVTFYTDIILFNLPRKSIKQKITKTRHLKTGIIHIEKIGTEKSKCVTVDSIDSCYLIGEFVKTHNSKGTRASQGVNADALRLQKNWMLSPKIYIDNSSGEEKEIKTINLRNIKSLGYLEELYEFNTDGNFDRISAMGMVMILRQERLKITQSLSSEKQEDFIEEDEFIRSNYDKKLNKLKYLDLDFKENKKVQYEI